MSNSPVNTFVIQLLRAAAAAGTVIICSRYLGPEGRGELGLLLFWVHLLMVANEYVGGSNLANMMQQTPLRLLLPVSLLWALFSPVAGAVLYLVMGGSTKMALALGVLAVPMALLAVQYNMYQGLARVGVRNRLQLLLELLRLGMLILIVALSGCQEKLSLGLVVQVFFWSLVLVLGISTWLLRKELREGIGSSERPPAALFSSGFWSQNGHLVQFLNYRLSLWWLTQLTGNHTAAGIYANALLIADTIWIFANSFGTIAHMRILQSSNPRFRADITLRYGMIALSGTVLACLLLAMVPGELFVLIFGDGFLPLKDTALLLIPAVLAVAASSLFSHYLHAANRFKALFLANLAGLVLQSLLAWWLIPGMGLKGACIAADAGFGLTLLLVYLMFRRDHPEARLHGAMRIRAMLRIVYRFGFR